MNLNIVGHWSGSTIRKFSTKINNKTLVTNINKGWQFLTLDNLNLFVKSDFNKAFDSFWTSVVTKLDSNQIVGLIIK